MKSINLKTTSRSQTRTHLWRPYSCLLLLLNCLGNSDAQTLVCGSVSGTWTPAGNPYIVTCDIVVPSGQTLTIQPGVVVWIGSNVTVTANGGFIKAVGTPSTRIRFQAPANSQYWNAISLVNSPGTNRFEYCDFVNAQTAITMWVSAAHGLNRVMDTEILNCTFTNCALQAIYGEAQGFTSFNHARSATLNALIKNCRFSSMGNGCVMRGSGGQNGAYIGYGYARPTIVANLFEDLTGTAFLMLIGSYTGSSQPAFLNNTVVNCRRGIDATDPWDVRVQNNIFVGSADAVNVSGSLSRTVSYNDLYGNTRNFTGYPSAYGQIILSNRNGTPCDILYNLFEEPRFLDPCSFLLATNSPCVDAGVPSVSDICSSVSRGSAVSDMGAFGGPDACNWMPPVSCFPPSVVIRPVLPSCLGQTITVTASATGTQPLGCQWWFNGFPLSGQTGTNLVLANLHRTNAGLYWVVISNVSGSVTSAPMQLVVNDACVDLCMYAGLNIAGLPGRTYELRYTTDLANTNFATWSFLATNTMGVGPWLWIDTNSCRSPRRFYGVKLLP